MKRIRDKELSGNLGVLLYRGAPFSGVLYERRSHDTYLARVVVDGTIDDLASDRRGGFTGELRDLTGALYDASTGDAKPVLVAGQLFTGLGCEFSGNFCTHEFECVGGTIVADRWWNKDGQLLRLIDNKEIQRDYEWASNGILRRGMVGVPGKSTAMVGCNEEGLLWSLVLRGNEIWSIAATEVDLKCIPLLNSTESISMAVDQKVSLVGDQITDEMLHRIKPAMLAGDLREISLRDTALSPRGIASVMAIPSLVGMNVETFASEQASAVRERMKDRPHLKVELRLK